jgi:beta-N-acetylhexosaminidase
VIEAGCDVVLECWGKLDVMEDIAPNVPRLSDASAERLIRAEETRLSRQASASTLTPQALSDLDRLIGLSQPEV